MSTESLLALAVSLGATMSELVGDALNQSMAEYKTNSQARLILGDYEAPAGLRELAGDRSLVDVLKITEIEWIALRTIQLPSLASKDGYLNLLITVRSVAPTKELLINNCNK